MDLVKKESTGSETGRDQFEADVNSRVGEGAAPAAQTPGGNAQKAQLAEKMREQREKGGGGGAAHAAKQMAGAGGGAPIPDAIRKRMEARFKADFSHVRLHTGGEAEEQTQAVNSKAVTMGANIFFAKGEGPENVEVLAHELAHVIQQGGAQPSASEAKVGGREDGAEGEAAKVSEAVSTGKDAPKIQEKSAPSTARRFGAGTYGHGGIEAEAATGKIDAKGDSREQGVKEMYSGNFMRDMNQLNVPTVIQGLEGLPKDITKKGGGDNSIGAKGAHDITTSIIQALAIMEFGPSVAKTLITGGENGTQNKIGAYKTEEHIDNPMGTGNKDLVNNNTDKNAKDKNGVPIAIGAPKVGVPSVDDSGKKTTEKDQDTQQQGSAWAGGQVENPKLYEISSAGLGNHIYNSVEATKHRWLKAAQLGPTPEGRSEYGAGSHAVEDYFSHSNFVEVAMNSYIEQALANKGKKGENKAQSQFADKVVSQNKANGGDGKGMTKQGYYIDTLYDNKVAAKGSKKGAPASRKAVTTGSFGSDDTKVSITEILMPALPKLQAALLKGVDQIFKIARSDGDSGYDKIAKMMSGTPEGAAVMQVLGGFTNAGMTAPVPDLSLKWKTVPISPGIFGKPWTVNLPYGIDHMTSAAPIGSAIGQYAHIYKKAHDMIALVEKYAAYAKKILIPIQPLIDQINEWIEAAELAVRTAIKEQVTAGLVAIVDSMSGRSKAEKDKEKAAHGGGKKNTDDEFSKDLGDALYHLHEGVEAIEEKTSIETRLKDGGDLSTGELGKDGSDPVSKAKVEALIGPVRELPPPTIEKKGDKTIVHHHYESAKPLPPSHSEIAKDHENYSMHAANGDTKNGDLNRHTSGDDKAGPEAGSPFFGIARSLAVQAVKHSDAQLQVVWAAQPGGGNRSLFGDGKNYQYENGGGAAADQKSQDSVLAEAGQRAASEKDRSKEEGSSFAQRDATGKDAATLKQTGVEQLMNLVDEFVSHPDDTQWWRPVVDGYIAKNPQDVFDSILRRNQTRGARK